MPDLPIQTVQRTGAPAPLILEQAEKENADYIVMGSHGPTAFYDLLVGSTTHQVLRKSPCPVMIVPPPIKKLPIVKRSNPSARSTSTTALRHATPRRTAP